MLVAFELLSFQFNPFFKVCPPGSPLRHPIRGAHIPGRAERGGAGGHGRRHRVHRAAAVRAGPAASLCSGCAGGGVAPIGGCGAGHFAGLGVSLASRIFLFPPAQRDPALRILAGAFSAKASTRLELEGEANPPRGGWCLPGQALHGCPDPTPWGGGQGSWPKIA